MGDSKRIRKHTQTIQVKPLQEEKSGERARRAFLTILRGGRRDLGLNILVEKPVTLGRAPDCDLCLHDMGVSWHHAQVQPTENKSYLVEDLESTNGTLVDGLSIQKPKQLKDGQKIFLGDTVVRFSLADDMEVGFHEQVTQLVGTDPLTGLDSKQKFDDALDYALLVARHLGQALSVFMMDLDGIKQINDTHGHLFGAFTIAQTGKIIARVLDGAGRACRFGGDEFTVFLPNHNNIAAVEVAEKIRHAVETERIEKNSVVLHPTICIGVATYPEDGNSALELVTAADRALYRAKAGGKNRVST